MPELLAQRLYALVLGYEDLNDHARLQRDPFLAAAAGKAEPLAYVLAERLRAIGLRGTALATATVGTIRTRLLKIGALFELSVRRVRVRLSSAFPLQELFATVWRQLRACPRESG